MSLSHRIKVAALVGVTIAATLVCFGLLQRHHHYKSEGYNQGAAEEHQKSPPPAGAVFQGKAPRPDPKPDRKEWREENDLKAQREMADWAFLMVVISCASATVTAAGVWFVRETLIATQGMMGEAAKATEAAQAAVSVTQEIGEKQIRAYLSVSGARFFVEEMFLHLELDILNSGQSPARSVKVSASVTMQTYDGGGTIHYESEDVVVETSEIGAASNGGAKVVMPATRLGDAIAIAIDASPFQVKCRVDWTDVFDKAQFSETVLSSMRPDNPRLGDGWIRHGELTTRRSNYQDRYGQQA